MQTMMLMNVGILKEIIIKPIMVGYINIQKQLGKELKMRNTLTVACFLV
ncbi:MAG: hypothetical protein LBC96_10230 [Lachnospiraceae bacterium]|jgi:hypothetical protein|nr:hypothetical protein [Lachnospiraceae bacterium]